MKKPHLCAGFLLFVRGARPSPFPRCRHFVSRPSVPPPGLRTLTRLVRQVVWLFLSCFALASLMPLASLAQALETVRLPIDPPEDVQDLPEIPSPTPVANDRRQVVRIGVGWVSEPSSELAAIRRSLERLETRLPQYRIVVRFMSPLSLTEALNEKRLDVFITDTRFYLEGALQGLNPLVSMISPVAKTAEASHAGVVIARSDNEAMRTLADALDGPLATLTAEPMTGFLPVAGLLVEAGYERRIRALRPSHQAGEMRELVRDVQRGRYQAGVIRSCYLEELLLTEGRRAVAGLKVLNPQAQDGLACLHSTPTYPGWVVSAGSTVSPNVTRDITQVLLDDPTPVRTAYWVFKADYSRSSELLKTLKIGPYDYLSLSDVDHLWAKWGREIQITLLVILGLALHGVVVSALVRRRTAQLERALEHERELQQKALDATQKIEQLQRLGVVNQMSTLIAHELRQPLAVIRNLARGAERTLEDEESTEDVTDVVGDALARIESQAQRANAIVDRVRAYAKGRVETLSESVPTALSLTDELVRILTAFSSSARAKGVEVVLRDSARVTLEINRLDFELMVLNLLSNAADAAREVPKPRIDVRLLANDSRVTLSVQNTGRVLSPEALEALRQPVPPTTKPDGLGLGITIVRHLASLNMAHLDYEAVKEGGVIATLSWQRHEDAR